ncbi:thioredoxin domain-containing protein, partial [Enterobacter hormaechei]|uniref:thioredoxin domain-containing protein n=1 Tax=Enterobacter hormaechei TaxID=158836 RepID=UPI0013D0B6EA
VEYASLTCGHCAHFHTTILPGLKEKYIDTGKVKLVFREFPLNQLDLAAYIFARCTLGSQGRALGDQDR